MLFMLLTEFEIRTVSYGPSFFRSSYSPSVKQGDHNYKKSANNARLIRTMRCLLYHFEKETFQVIG